MLAKILLGLVLLVAGAWLLLPPFTGLAYQGATWNEFRDVVLGILPFLVAFAGALIIWVEMEDRKTQ